MSIFRAHVVLAGVLMFLTAGADAALPALFRLVQPPPCPHCSMRGCRCGAGCCDTHRCRRPQTTNHASLSHLSAQQGQGAAVEPDTAVGQDTAVGAGTAAPAEREPAVNPRCSGADREALPPAGGGRPALIARSVSLAPPGGAGSQPETPATRTPSLLQEPPTPPPRTTV